jgi:hypothetical protein
MVVLCICGIVLYFVLLVSDSNRSTHTHYTTLTITTGTGSEQCPGNTGSDYISEMRKATTKEFV